MQYETKILPRSEIEISVILPFPEFEPHVKRAAVLLSEENEIEGFRRGRAPYDIVKNRFGEAAIYERAAELAIKKTHPEIVRELVTSNQLQNPIGRPEITVTKLAPGNELEYKARLALLPAVKLPDYKSIAKRAQKERKDVSVTDEEITKTLDWVRESRAVGEGESRKVPELTEEFVKSLGEFPTVEAFKQSVADGIAREKEARERQRIRTRILEEIAKAAVIEIPEVLIVSELHTMLGELKSGVERMGMKWEDYLAHIKKTPDELIKGWREDALNRARSALSLHEIGRVENIQPTAEEIEARVNEHLVQFKTAEEAEKNIDPESLREYTKGVLRNEKVFEFLEGFSEKG